VPDAPVPTAADSPAAEEHAAPSSPPTPPRALRKRVQPALTGPLPRTHASDSHPQAHEPHARADASDSELPPQRYVAPPAEAAVPARGSSATTSSSALPSVSPRTGVDEEMKLMARAHTLLQEKRPLDALGILREHAVRFPRGQLADSRALTRMLALCAAGQREHARQEAMRFLADHPDSPFAGRARAVCAP
jgi:hypothetical protein